MTPDLGFLKDRIKCPVCGNLISKHYINVGKLVVSASENLFYDLCFCDNCKCVYWIVLDIKYKKLVSMQLLQTENNLNGSVWVDEDDTWCYCKACGRYHSKPFFRKTQYCSDCGAYMQNYIRE